MAGGTEKGAELAVLPQRPDVVADDVLLAIMLVEVGISCAITDIALDEYAGTAFIRVNGKRAGMVVVDIVYQIAPHNRTRRVSQAIDAPHISQHAATDIVDMVVFHDFIQLRAPFTASDAAVRHIMNMVVMNMGA